MDIYECLPVFLNPALPSQSPLDTVSGINMSNVFNTHTHTHIHTNTHSDTHTPTHTHTHTRGRAQAYRSRGPQSSPSALTIRAARLFLSPCRPYTLRLFKATSQLK